jgi:hypothetical protein
MSKNMFSYPKKLILAFFTLLLINQNIDAQSCTHEKSPPSHELSYLGLFNLSHLNLFQHVNVTCKR